MAHEIESTDTAGYRQVGAWHALGRVWDGERTALEAQAEFLPWEVKESDGVNAIVFPDGDDHGLRLTTDTHKVTYRADTQKILGVVGSGYQIVQNSELAEIADALTTADPFGSTTVESIGSIRDGRRVWLQLRRPEREAQRGDILRPYILLANGHDGSMGLHMSVGSMRVVCSNTLHWAMSSNKKAMTLRHCGDMKAKVEEAKSLFTDLLYAERQQAEAEQANDARDYDDMFGAGATMKHKAVGAAMALI